MSSWHLFCRWEFSTCQMHLALLDLQGFLMSFWSKNVTFKPSVTGHVVSLHLYSSAKFILWSVEQPHLSSELKLKDSENLKKHLGLLQDQTAHHTNIPSGLSVREGGRSLYLSSQEGGQKDRASARPSHFCCSRVHLQRNEADTQISLCVTRICAQASCALS